MPDSPSTGTCFLRTLEFLHDLHAAHDTNAPFFTSVGRVFDFIDNRLFQLFKQFGFRNRWVRVFFGGETRTHSEIKATAVLVISNPPPGCRKEPEKDGQFSWSDPQII